MNDFLTVDELVKKADQQIDSYIQDPKKMQEYLSFIASVENKYSARNMAMVFKQFNEATVLKSFTDWKKQGVQIKKGEKGIKILQPVTKQYVNIDGTVWFKSNWTKEIYQKIKDKELKVEKNVIAMKLTNTFDISQTTLKKEQYPKNYFATFIKGEPENEQYHQKIFNELKEFLATKNIPVFESEWLGQMKGFTDHNSIYLNEHNSTKQNVRTLLHEYGHIKCNDPLEYTSRPEREYQAEMIAYVFCKKFNVDTEEYNLGYIKNWVNNTTQKDRIDWAKNVINVARDINDEFELYFQKKQIEQEKEIKQQELQEEQFYQNEETVETQNNYKQKAFTL